MYSVPCFPDDMFEFIKTRFIVHLFSYSNTFFLARHYYAIKLARVILYSCESACISLSLLRSLSL